MIVGMGCAASAQRHVRLQEYKNIGSADTAKGLITLFSSLPARSTKSECIMYVPVAFKQHCIGAQHMMHHHGLERAGKPSDGEEKRGTREVSTPGNSRAEQRNKTPGYHYAQHRPQKQERRNAPTKQASTPGS